MHVKGTFQCGKVKKFNSGTGAPTGPSTTAGKEQILYDGTSKLLSSDTNCHSVTEFTLTIRNGAKYAGQDRGGDVLRPRLPEQADQVVPGRSRRVDPGDVRGVHVLATAASASSRVSPW